MSSNMGASATLSMNLYILDNEGRLPLLIARLCTKAWRQYKNVVVLLPEKLHTAVSEALWNTESDSFLPHQVGTTNDKDIIQLASPTSQPSNATVVFNVNPKALKPIDFEPTCQKYAMIFTDRAPARAHFSYYRKKGFSIEHYLL